METHTVRARPTVANSPSCGPCDRPKMTPTVKEFHPPRQSLKRYVHYIISDVSLTVSGDIDPISPVNSMKTHDVLHPG